MTSGCIRASIVDAFSHGLRTIVVGECCGDQQQEAHRANLADVGRRYADVIGVDEAVAGLEAIAGA
jgi:maleamate amidohydrolase